jgi:hypothetical protein
MKFNIFFIILVILLFVFSRGIAFAQTNPASKSEPAVSNPYAEGLNGVVVANTITPAGHQFYRLFALAWREKPESETYSLSVVESRVRQRFTVVTLYYSNQSLYSAILPTRFPALQSLVDQSLDAVSSRLLTLELGASESDPDMAADDIWYFSIKN